MNIYKKISEHIILIAWIVALFAMGGSLFFSEIMSLPPCVLCWYQRIAMYPLVAILLIGFFLSDKNVLKYALPFSLIGFIIALYHNLLYYGIIPESITPCTLGISCTTRQIEWLSFITIPLLSLMAFAIINICLFIFYKTNRAD